MEKQRNLENKINYIISKGKHNRIKSKFDALRSNVDNQEQLFGYPFPKKPEELYYKRNETFGSLDRELYWEACVLSSFSKEIGGFLSLKTSYEECIIREDYKAASSILSKVKDEFGWSLWWVENNLALLEASKGLDKQKEFSHVLIENDEVDLRIKFLTFYFSSRAEKNVSAESFNSMLLEEMSESNYSKEVADYLIFKLNIFNEEEINSFTKVLRLDRGLPIIDRFLTLIRVLQLICSYKPVKKTYTMLAKIISLLDTIKCNEVETLSLYTSGKINNTCTEQSNKTLRTLNLYTSGDYFQCAKACQEYLVDSPLLFELWELYAKSIIRLKDTGVDFPADGWVVKALVELLLRTKASDGAFQRLTKFSLVNSSFSISYQFMGFLDAEYKPSLKEKYHYCLLGALNASVYNPNHSFSLLGHTKHLFLSKLNKQFPESVVIKFFQAIHDKHNKCISLLKALNITEARKVKHVALLQYELGNIEQALKNYELLGLSDSSLDRQDAIRGLIKCYYFQKNYKACVKLIVDSYMENDAYLIFLPAKEILAEEGLIEQCDIFDQISLSILYNIYSDSYGLLDLEEEKFLAIREFLYFMGINKPSELKTADLDGQNKLVIYFLHKVCTVIAIDGIPTFKSPEEVLEERIKICQSLSSLDEISKTVYQDEIKMLTHQIMVNQCIQEIDNSRIYVDEQGVKKAIEREVQEKFSRYQEFLSKGMNPILFDLTGSARKLQEKMRSSNGFRTPADEVRTLFYSMVSDIKNQFVNSKEYGLDGHLSVRIRHGTLSGELRSPLQSANLVTQKNDAGAYHDNSYWADKCSTLPEDKQKHLMLALAKFSEEVDGVIDLVKNEWIQIYSERKQQGKFIFVSDEKVLNIIMSSITVETTYEEFYKSIIETLWLQTDACLKKIRYEMRFTLEPQVIKMFEDLRMSVEALSHDCDMSDFLSTVANTKSEMSSAIERVSNWFTRSSSTVYQDYSANILADICVATIRNLNPNKNFIPDVDVDESFTLVGESIASLTAIMYILVDNAIHKSGFSRIPEVKILISKRGDILTLKVTNELSSSIDVEELRRKLEEVKRLIGSESSLENVSEEGGTGLPKVMKIIHFDIQAAGRFDFNVDDDHLCEITIEIESGSLFV